MAEKYNITPSKRAKTPITAAARLHEFEESPKVCGKTYRSLVGAVLYVSVATRPDISYALSILSSYATDPRMKHYDAAIRLLRYLVNISHYK